MNEQPRWLRERTVAEMLDLGVQTLRNWRHQGRGPEYDKPTPRCVRYRLADVIAFMQNEGTKRP